MRPQHPVAPTLGQVMRRPQWIAALCAALLVALFFAYLAQWQMSHAVRPDSGSAHDTETAVPLTQLALPGTPVTDKTAGARIEFDAVLHLADLRIVADRAHAGRTGYWLAGPAIVQQQDGSTAALAVALGWTATVTQAQQALAQLQNKAVLTDAARESLLQPTPFTGRYNPTESPKPPRVEAGTAILETMSPPQLLNLWQPEVAKLPTYAGFAVLDPDNNYFRSVTLEQIEQQPPKPAETINWLNLFYALEWVIFAGFAVYFWVRLCRDAHEKELEIFALQNQQ